MLSRWNIINTILSTSSDEQSMATVHCFACAAMPCNVRWHTCTGALLMCYSTQYLLTHTVSRDAPLVAHINIDMVILAHAHGKQPTHGGHGVVVQPAKPPVEINFTAPLGGTAKCAGLLGTVHKCSAVSIEDRLFCANYVGNLRWQRGNSMRPSMWSTVSLTVGLVEIQLILSNIADSTKKVHLTETIFVGYKVVLLPQLIL